MKIPHETIVLAADGGRALLFRNEGDGKYPVLQTLDHDERHTAHTREIGTDQPGRVFQSVGKRRGSVAQTDWHEQGEVDFAGHVAMLLSEAAETCGADIIILAPPRFLGLLRDCLPPAVRSRVAAEIDKDFAHRSADDIVAAIGAHVASRRG